MNTLTPDVYKLIEDKVNSEIDRFKSEQSEVETPKIGLHSMFTITTPTQDQLDDESNSMSGPGPEGTINLV